MAAMLMLIISAHDHNGEETQPSISRRVFLLHDSLLCACSISALMALSAVCVSTVVTLGSSHTSNSN